MKADSASSTSLLIARATVMADSIPALRPLLVPGSVEPTRKLVEASARAWWFDFALRHASARRALLLLERLLLPGVMAHWFARKRLLDELAGEAIAAGCRQLVVLGAGLDTLPYRVHSSGAVDACFELDHPATQQTKRRVFPDGPALAPIDFMHDSVAETLHAQPRFDPRKPTLYVAEGLLMYLAPERVDALFRELAGLSAPGSRFAFTFMEARPGQPIAFHNARRAITWWLQWRGEPFRWALRRDAAAEFAAQHGWELASLSSPEDLRQRFLSPNGLDSTPLAIGESVALARLPSK